MIYRGMPLLVDCYNVLYASMPVNLAGLDETALCWRLSRSLWCGGRITVVCDGVVKPHGPARSPVDAVDLIYSGPDRTADDVIMAMIDVESAPRRLEVVSSDRQIQKAARRRRCRVLDSVEFIHRLARSRGGKNRAAPRTTEGDITAPLDEREVAHWLKQFGVDPSRRSGPLDQSGQPLDPDLDLE